MRYLLDSHIVLAIVEGRVDDLPASARRIVSTPTNALLVSTASLWEIAIKTRIGKLSFPMALAELPNAVHDAGWHILPIGARHAIEPHDPEPVTRDPVDRLLLAQYAVEGIRLVTVDRALVDHPLSATVP